MRTPLSSGLAAASMGLLLLGLALRSWQVLLLALPPMIVLALGSLAPPPKPAAAAPPVVRAGRLPSDRSGHRVLGRPGIRRRGRGTPHQLEGVRAPRAPLHERVRGGALGGRGHRGRRAARVVRGHGGGQSGRTRGPSGPRDRGPRPRDEEPGRLDRVPPGDRLGPARLRTEAAIPDPGPPGPREARRGVARLPRGSRPLAVLSAGLPHRPHHAAAGPGRARGGDRTRRPRVRHRDRVAVRPRDRTADSAGHAGGPDGLSDPGHGTGEPGRPTAACRPSRRLGSGDPPRARPPEDDRMAASRLMSPGLRWTPFALLALLESWVGWDLLAVPDRRWITALALPFLANLMLLHFSRGSHRRW